MEGDKLVLTRLDNSSNCHILCPNTLILKFSGLKTKDIEDCNNWFLREAEDEVVSTKPKMVHHKVTFEYKPTIVMAHGFDKCYFVNRNNYSCSKCTKFIYIEDNQVQ